MTLFTPWLGTDWDFGGQEKMHLCFNTHLMDFLHFSVDIIFKNNHLKIITLGTSTANFCLTFYIINIARYFWAWRYQIHFFCRVERICCGSVVHLEAVEWSMPSSVGVRQACLLDYVQTSKRTRRIPACSRRPLRDPAAGSELLERRAGSS